MSLEGNPLDLNNFPEDYNSRENDKQVVEDNSSSSTGRRKKRSSIKEVIDESGKVYECRFCSLKFYKSQALGGHMNRHRQERETETLNRARQLVFTTDNLPVHHNLGVQPIPHGALYNQLPNMGDPNLYRPLYPPPRLFSNSTSMHLPPPQPHVPQPHPQFLYPSPPPPRLIPYTSQYLPNQDYILGHGLAGNYDYSRARPSQDTVHYACIGTPIGQDFKSSSGGSHSDAAASGGGRGQNYFQDGF